MSNVLAVTNGQVITDHDQFASISWCSKKYLGCSICVSVSVKDGKIILEISLHSPFGSWNKTVSFSSSICFTFRPVKSLKLEICITGYKAEPTEICFTLGGKICLNFFGQWRCGPELSHNFCVALPGHGYLDGPALERLSDVEFATLYLVALQTEESRSCNCH